MKDRVSKACFFTITGVIVLKDAKFCGEKVYLDRSFHRRKNLIDLRI